jgi:DNA helicase-2/ATP-dependent DNA helicase PcrA
MELFKQFDFYLNKYNLEQKKAITSKKDKILCVAGAGSGKTTVLTTRIDFLLKFRSVDPGKVLAITFTRKARMEMMERLASLGHGDVRVETFNSFSEKILRKYNDLIYGKVVKMMSYGDKIKLFKEALGSLKISPQGAVENYFKKQQLKLKTPDKLFNIFMNDCFFIVDYYKSKGEEVQDFSNEAENVLSAKMVYVLCKYIETRMRNDGLRTHMDQIVDTINFFKQNKDYIPSFEHVLVDEYQDVNDLQIELISLLEAPNLFCVGDPRQSIFGWRGSNIKHVLEFQEVYDGAEVVSLRKNYRSSKVIVDFMNEAIRPMALPNLEASNEGGKKVKLLNFKNENAEFEFVLQSVLASTVPREDIFVLARTNRQLSDLSRLFSERGVTHVTKSDEMKMVEAGQGQVTLATVHAIKGLEASMVFVVGCTMNNFPCKGSEHPVVDLIKIDEYDKEDEERRLFYVALSRAKEQLYLTYSSRRHSYYITEAMKKQMGMSKGKSWYQDRSLKEFA